jgi:glycosyltransferase involved in cell wall biosynthesis
MADVLRTNRVDVVLAEYGQTGVAILPACRLAGIPLVVHFHGHDASNHDMLARFGEAYREMFRHAAAVIAVSHPMAEALVTLGCPEERLTVNPCAPADEFFDVKPDYGGNFVVAVGRLTDKKAPHLTLLAFNRALQSCPELHLTMIGDGPLVGVCKDLVRALDLESRVDLVGAAAHERVREEMANAFLFVQHSVTAVDGDSEGTPVAVLEAGAAGLPVVATRHAGIPDVIVDGETGFLVDEWDVSIMAARMVALSRDRGKARAFGECARERVHRHFSMDRHLSCLRRVLAEAASGVDSVQNRKQAHLMAPE